MGVGGGRGADFYTAMQIASNMVRSLGMGKSGVVGDFLYYASSYNGGTSHYMSEKTKETMDADVQDILQSCIKDVETILTEKRDLLEYFAQELYTKQELEYDEIVAIFDKFNLKPATRINAV